jgi:hypothetical protein
MVFLVEDFFDEVGMCWDLFGVVRGSSVYFLWVKTREVGPTDGAPLTLGIDPKEIK